MDGVVARMNEACGARGLEWRWARGPALEYGQVEVRDIGCTVWSVCDVADVVEGSK